MNRRNWLASLLGIFAAKKATTTPYTLMNGTPIHRGKTVTVGNIYLTDKRQEKTRIDWINPGNITTDIQ